MGHSQLGCNVASACSISDDKGRARREIAGIVITFRCQLRDRAVEAGSNRRNYWFLKRTRSDDHGLGDYVPTIIELRGEPLVRTAFEPSHAISGSHPKVEMAGVGFEIVRKLISRWIAFRVPIERKAGQRTKCARGEQRQGIVATAPTVADAGMAINDQE
ncbi:hypothetical protein GCM10007989_13600 [Devosia pacifica]|uniref:Uncharacterized protein n=1 Tax=Devosia pacifica TaxID=1335967 RepID=A0A918S1G3_9HYPH|nr:hypothetical protein GCM10007989_13600 [Devosia pacifica]